MRLIFAVPALAVTLALAGCVPAAPAPTPTQTGAEAPTPTPTADSRTAPQPALDLGCAELYSVAELQPVFAAQLGVKLDEKSPPVGLAGAAWLQQTGGLRCVIGGTNRTDGSFDEGLALRIQPGGAAEYDATLGTISLPGTATDTIGDRSYLYCQGYDTASTCNALVLVGDWFIDAQITDSQQATTEEATDYATSVLASVADRVAEAGPARPLWVPPVTPDPAPLCADPGAAAALLGLDPASLTVEGGNFGYPGANVSCSWSGPDGAFVTVAGLTGAQWAFDAIAASPDKIIMRWLAPGSLIDVSGTDGTIVSFVDSVYVLFVRDGTLTSLTFDDLERDPPTVTARIQAFVDAMP